MYRRKSFLKLANVLIIHVLVWQPAEKSFEVHKIDLTSSVYRQLQWKAFIINII